MDFVIVFEKNHKDDEEYIHYCQWTGNAAELEKLFAAMECADDEELLGGDYSSFFFSRVCIPEAAVDAHMKIRHTFKKHVGFYKCPEFSEDPYEAAKELDELYYRGRLGNFFRPLPS